MKSPAHEADVTRRIQLEDALKHLLDCDESSRGATVDSLAGALSQPRHKAAEVLGRLRARNLAHAAKDSHHLTKDGRLYALQVVRTHRLYETWLARETGTPPDKWHEVAHKAEHHLAPADVDALANKLSNPRFDPHGDPIPTRDGKLPKRALSALASWPDGNSACIAHIEDEPAILFAKTQLLGLAPGTRIDNPRHLNDGSIEADVEGRCITLPAAITPLIHVDSPAPDELLPIGLHRLSDLAVGSTAVVHGLAPSCAGAERNRLLDLGVTPGTPIRCEFTSPLGSPRSYTIRNTLIALRSYQAERVLVEPPTATNA